jgi:hypothetical protein
MVVGGGRWKFSQVSVTPEWTPNLLKVKERKKTLQAKEPGGTQVLRKVLALCGGSERQ